jgi:hypothetical protein
MFQLVFSLDGKCRRCESAVTRGWLGQWGFPLNETAQAELHLLQEILKSPERVLPRLQQTSTGSKRATEVINLPSKDEGWMIKKNRITGPGGTSNPSVAARRQVTLAALMPAAAREVKDVAITDVKDEATLYRIHKKLHRRRSRAHAEMEVTWTVRHTSRRPKEIVTTQRTLQFSTPLLT